MKKSHALFIGRFQPFHNGHLDALENILKENKKLTIVIGSSQEKNTEKNPWSGEERKNILEKLFKNKIQIDIKLLPDKHDDDLWIKSLQEKIIYFDIIYSGNDWVINICKKYNIQSKKIKYNLQISATEIRKRLKDKKDISNLVPEIINEWIIQK